MPPAIFETTIPASERPHTHVLGRTVTGIGFNCNRMNKFLYPPAYEDGTNKEFRNVGY
jgi:hypothetical protein